MALTVKLTPGYNWTEGELVTIAKLILAANPTIELEGTISAASLADNSITLAKLIVGILSADAAGRSRMADGYLTLAKIAAGIFTADAAGRAPFAADVIDNSLLADDAVQTAQIKDAQVTLAKLSAGIIASATAKASPTTADSVLIADAADANATKKATLAALNTLFTPTQFTSAETAIATSDVGLVINTAHSLGAVPAKVRAVLVCKSTDLGYAANDEVDVSGSVHHSGTVSFVVGANATNVFVVRDQAAETGHYQLANKTTGVVGNCAELKWRLKVYAWV